MTKPPRGAPGAATKSEDTAVPILVQSVAPIKRLPAASYRTGSGKEPVRDWLKQELSKDDRVKIGVAIKRVEIEWPIGKPTCAPLSDGLWEVRATLENRIARVIFCVHDETMVLLHGFIKKSQKTPQSDLELAIRRKRDVEKADAKA